MACKPICRLCPKFIITQAVEYDGTNLIWTLPAGSYQRREKYCLVFAQAIPVDTTIVAPVFIRIGDGATLYPLNKRNCAQATACSIRTRTRYSTIVTTTPTGGSFRLIGEPCCAPDNSPEAIDGGEPA